jgi:site-specific DNA-cytosine methylase
MHILHIFSGYNTFSTAAHNHKIRVTSIDLKHYKGCPAPTITCDFLTFDFYQFHPKTFDFILIGFPCTTFSKASGNHHFFNNIPMTRQAHNSIQMISKLKDILNYFTCFWMIENPVSALFSNYYFLQHFDISKYNRIKVHQFLYGHCTFKHTELLTNKHVLWLDNTVYRVNGKNFCPKFDRLSLQVRQSYPPAFCEAIIKFILI